MDVAPADTNNARVETADAKSADMLQLTAHTMGGAQVKVPMSPTATVQQLREAVQQSLDMGPFGFRMMAGGALLHPPTAQLLELGVQDGSDVMILKEFARDYTTITSFDRTFSCQSYPNGVLIDKQSRLYVAHYFGSLTVYDSSLCLLHTVKLPATQPSQMAMSDDGELLVAFRMPGKVGVFDTSTFAALRFVGQDCGSADGVAVCGQTVFVSDRGRARVRTFDLADGTAGQSWGGGDLGYFFAHPSGLAVVEQRWLAVADRGQDCLWLIDVHDGKLVNKLTERLRSPNDVAVDSAGNLLVMDTGNERIAVFRQDGTLLASVMEGFFLDKGNTFSYLACNHDTGAIAVSNNDEHKIAVLPPLV